MPKIDSINNISSILNQSLKCRTIWTVGSSGNRGFLTKMRGLDKVRYSHFATSSFLRTTPNDQAFLYGFQSTLGNTVLLVGDSGSKWGWGIASKVVLFGPLMWG